MSGYPQDPGNEIKEKKKNDIIINVFVTMIFGEKKWNQELGFIVETIGRF